MADMPSPVIQAQGLSKTYDGVEALKSLTMDVPPKSIFAFLGPNGAGKTTFIKMMLGLVRPTSGQGRLLGAPVGSMLVGSKAFIEDARLVRKMLGGGMRQAGVLAAAGLVALEESPKRLHVDHENARFLAEELHEIPGINIDPAKVQSNILFLDVAGTGLTSFEISKRLAAQDVLANGVKPATSANMTVTSGWLSAMTPGLRLRRSAIGPGRMFCRRSSDRRRAASRARTKYCSRR